MQRNFWVLNKFENVFRVVTAETPAGAAKKALELYNDESFIPKTAGEIYFVVIPIEGGEATFEVCPKVCWTIR